VSDLISGVLRFVVRGLLLLMGLVFLASLLAAAMVLVLLGALRVLWARLTGKPIAPWAFRVDPRAQWSRFHTATGRWSGAAAAPSGRSNGLKDVVDVEVKPPKVSGSS
jgi:hypothetical protein